MLLGTLAGTAIDAHERDLGQSPAATRPRGASGSPLPGLSLGSSWSSYQDAQRAMLEFNERREAEFEDGHPAAP